MAHISLDFKSMSLTRNVSLEIFLPFGEGFPNEGGPYKTLYFLPGFSSSAKELATYLGFRLQSVLKNLAIVIVDGDNSFYVNQRAGFARYSDFIQEELIEFTRNLLPLSNKREDTFIGGISMGGYGAIINGIQGTETFGKIVAMSPGLDFYELAERDDNEFTEELFTELFDTKQAYLDSENHHQTVLLKALGNQQSIPDIFVCCGTEDTLVYPNTIRYVDFLKRNEIPVSFIEDSGNHDVMFWEKMLDPALSFLNT